MAHRLASGTIQRNHEGTPYRDIYSGKRSMFERFPRPEGQVMRIMGQRIKKIVDEEGDEVDIRGVLAIVFPEGIP